MNYLLIYSILLSFLREYLSVLLKPIIAILTKEKTLLTDSKKEISDLHNELSKISITDEFAKYARLQRKLNKLKAQVDSNVSEQLQESVKVRFIVTTASRTIMGIIFIIFLWIYKYEPVVVFPESWMSPISPLISFPTSVNGAVGLPFWFSVCNAFVKTAGNIFPSFSRK